MFEFKDCIDVAISLCLKSIIEKSKSAHILLLLSSMILLPENNHMIDVIKKILNRMFKNSKDHVIIGITKTRLVETHWDEDEIVDVAAGVNGETRNFQGYTIMIVEQDNVESINNVLDEVFKKRCIKK